MRATTDITHLEEYREIVHCLIYNADQHAMQGIVGGARVRVKADIGIRSWC